MNAVDRLKEITAAANLKSRPAQREAAIFVRSDDSKLKSDFDLVAKEYGLQATGEYELARDIARANKEDAVMCFGAIADRIRNTVIATGINERIRSRIAAEKEESNA